MKLPEDKKERTKVLILIAIGSILVVYGLFVGVVSPLVKGKKDRMDRIDALQEKLRKAEKATARMGEDQRACSNALCRLDDLSNRKGVVLRDRLGNFLLSATEIVDRHAQKAGVTILGYKENGMSQLPQAASRSTPPVFNGYTVTVQVQGDTRDLVRLLKEIETDNPYLSVSSIGITAQQGKPNRHQMSFEVQWPIWVDSKMPVRLATQLQDVSQGNVPTRPAAPQQQEHP
jgi:hypothetical protein